MPTGNILLLKLITFEKKPCALKLHFTSKLCRLISFKICTNFFHQIEVHLYRDYR